MSLSLQQRTWWRLLEAPIGRRRLLAGGAAGGAAGLALAAIGCDDSVTTDTQQATPGGTLRFGTTLPPSFGLDPHVETAGWLPIIARLYGYPLHADPRSDDILLDHLESYEQPDPVTYVLRLRTDARFHASAPALGRAVHAEDLVVSLRRFRDNPLSVNKYWHRRILAAEGAPDLRTVIVTTRSPYVYSLAEIGGINAGAIIPREAIEQSMNLTSAGAGSGPLELDAAEPKSVALRRFAAYHGEPTRVHGMRWHLFNNTSDMAAALRARAIDVAPVATAADADAIARDEKGLIVVPEPSFATVALALRIDRPPFDDERVRRAIDLALDPASVVEASGLSDDDAGPTGPVNVHLADGFWSLDEEEMATSRGTEDDPRAEARALVDAAGASGQRFSLQVAGVENLPAVAEAVRSQLTAIDLRAEIEVKPLLAWYVDSRRGNFDASIVALPPYEHPDGALRWCHPDGPEGDGNPLGLSEPELERVIERAREEPDRDGRRELVLQAQRLALRTHALLPLMATTGHTLTWDYVQESGLDLPGSLARYHARQWLDLPVEGRPD